MCTVSWARAPGGYVFYFNRDEAKTRPPAAGPIERTRAGVRFLAPTDGEQGGSWILVNEFGLTLGLLNHYPPGYQAGSQDRPSRGRLVLDCADLADSDGLDQRLADLGLTPYPPFRMVAIDRGGARLLIWDGTRLEGAGDRRVEPPVTSSSWEPERVEGFRRALFDRAMVTADDRISGLEAFHHRHDASRPAESVLMSRPDACTHSVVRIDVEEGLARLHYEPQPWIEQPKVPVRATLPLRL